MFESNQHAVATLYLAYLDRAPDADGLAYWTAQLDAGASYFEIARAFGASAEAQDIYPELRSDSLDRPESFVFRAIENIFDRDATDGDIGYWAQQIRDGKPTWQVLAEMPLAAQNGDSYRIDNTIDVSLYFTDQAAGAGIEVELPAARDLINGAGITYDARLDAKQDIHDYLFPKVEHPGPSEPSEPELPDGMFVVNFDDLPQVEGPGQVPDNYKGLKWTASSYLSGNQPDDDVEDFPGLANVTDNAAFVNTTSSITIESDKPFSLIDFNVASTLDTGLITELIIQLVGSKFDKYLVSTQRVSYIGTSDYQLYETKFNSFDDLKSVEITLVDYPTSGADYSSELFGAILDDMTFYM